MPPLSDAIQDYLKAIYKLQARTARHDHRARARAARLAGVRVGDGEEARRTRPDRARALPRRQLTDAGERVALEVIRHHRLLELYLAQTLGLTSTTSTTRPTGSST